MKSDSRHPLSITVSIVVGAVALVGLGISPPVDAYTYTKTLACTPYATEPVQQGVLPRGNCSNRTESSCTCPGNVYPCEGSPTVGCGLCTVASFPAEFGSNCDDNTDCGTGGFCSFAAQCDLGCTYLISLPYNVSSPVMTKASDLFHAFGGGTNVLWVSKFDTLNDTEYFWHPSRGCTGIAGNAGQEIDCLDPCFCIDTTAGSAFAVTARPPGASATFTGNDDQYHLILRGQGPNSRAGDNTISLPLNTHLRFANQLIDDINNQFGQTVVVQVARFLQPLNALDPYTGQTGTAFPLKPMEGYVVTVNQDVIYSPPFAPPSGSGLGLAYVIKGTANSLEYAWAISGVCTVPPSGNACTSDTGCDTSPGSGDGRCTGCSSLNEPFDHGIGSSAGQIAQEFADSVTENCKQKYTAASWAFGNIFSITPIGSGSTSNIQLYVGSAGNANQLVTNGEVTFNPTISIAPTSPASEVVTTTPTLGEWGQLAMIFSVLAVGIFLLMRGRRM